MADAQLKDYLTVGGALVTDPATPGEGDTYTLGVDPDVIDKAEGAVQGPASSTDNALVRYDGVTGLLVQDSAVTVDDNGNVAWTGALKPPGPLAVAYAASVALDVAEDNDFAVAALTGNITFGFSNYAAGRAGVIDLVQDGTGSHTVSWDDDSGAITFLVPYDADDAEIPADFPDASANARVVIHYRFLTATICELSAYKIGAMS